MLDKREYLSLTEAARRLGISEPALRRRVDRGQLAVYSNPIDLRSRLIKTADLERYTVPQPVMPADVERGSGEAAMSAA